MINSFVNKSTKVVFPYSNFKSVNIHGFALNQLALHSTTMDLLCRRGPLKFIFNIKYFLQFSVLPLQSFPGLIARIPVFHTENRGSNPAGGNKVLHFLPLFSNFQEVLWLFAKISNRNGHQKWLFIH